VKILVISDIHSNFHALRAVIEKADNCDAILCAGDITGYGAFPVECIHQARVMEWKTVAGNHDAAISTKDTDWFNDEARDAIRINREMIKTNDLMWLAGIPQSLTLNLGITKITIFHGSPTEPLTSYVFPNDMENYAHLYLGHTESDLIILGHTHIPHIVYRPEGVVLNPGSVGQPRDGDPRASFAIVNLPELKVEIRRIEYDIDAAAEAIRDSGIPERFAKRLYQGL